MDAFEIEELSLTYHSCNHLINKNVPLKDIFKILTSLELLLLV